MATKNKELLKRSRDKWYHANKQKQIDRQLQRRKELTQLLQRYKSFLKCTDCNMSFRGKEKCCDFHHIDPTNKSGLVGNMIRNSKMSLKRELVKCIPLCANCHRMRH